MNLWKLLRAIAAELARPDDQGVDWYAWATNQLSHLAVALLATALLLSLGLDATTATLTTVSLATIKEIADLLAGSPDEWRALRDSLRDWVFMALGAVLIYTVTHHLDAWTLCAAATALALIASGILPRARRALAAKTSL
jgi:hypothetical protein